MKVAAVLAVGLSLTAGGAIVNVDINGVSNFPGPEPDPLNPTYVGQGPVGGGTNFNAVLVDSRVPGAASGDWHEGDFFLTITAANFLDASGNTTTIGFTTSPVGGDGGSDVVSATDSAALFADYIFVGYAPHASDATASFTISGLGAAPVVDLYFYGNAVGAVTIAGTDPASFADNGIFTAGNTRFFKQVPVAGGEVAGTFGSGSVVGGFTIVTPEPRPFVKSISPTGNAVRQTPVIEVDLQDYVTEVAANSIQLVFNGQAVTPTITKPAGTNVTVVTYSPGTLPQASTNTVRIIFSDTSTPPIVQTNEFSFVTISEPTAAGTVNIDFNGFRVNDGAPISFVGPGAAGGGKSFNGLSADSTLPDGSDNDGLTVGGTNLLNSLGDGTTVSFTITPVGGRNTGTPADATAVGALLNDAIFVGRFGQQSGTAAFTIGGLTSPAVDLYFYLGPESAAQPINIPGASPTVFTGAGDFTSANTVYFSHAPVTGGRVTGTLGTADLGYAAISGVSIVAPLPLPYVASAAPLGRGVPTNAVISITLGDYVTQVATNTIELSLNGVTLSPSITKSAALTTVSYDPKGTLAPSSSNLVQIVFANNATPAVVQTNEFSFRVSRTIAGAPPTIAVNFRADVVAGGPNCVMAADDAAGVIPTANWNNVPGATMNVTGLLDWSGAPTSANLDIVSSALQLYQIGNTASEPGDNEMMSGHIYVGGTDTIDVTVSGLAAPYTTGLGYDLYVYFRSGTGAWPHTYEVLDASGASVAGPVTVRDSNEIGFDGTYIASDGNGSAGHYYRFSKLHLGTFTLRTQPVTPPTSYAYFSGLQIVSVVASQPPQVLSFAPRDVVVSNAPIVITIQDGGTQLDPSTIQLSLNGSAVVPSVNKPAGTNVTTITYQPTAAQLRFPTNDVAFIFGDTATPSVYQTNRFSYVYLSYPAAPAGTIGINFRADDDTQTLAPTDTAGVLASANWNNVPGATTNVTALLNSAGVATTAIAAITGSPIAYQAANTAAPGGDAKMMTGHIYIGAGGKIDVAITGLDAAVASTGYDVYVYYRSGAGAFQQSFTILDTAGATNAGPATVLDSQTIGFNGLYVQSDGAGSAGHYYKFSNLRLPAFTLEAVPVVGYAYLSGMQIVPSAPSLKLSIGRGAGGSVVLTWTGNATLQSATQVKGTWADVTGQSSPYTTTPSEASKFYRLKQ